MIKTQDQNSKNYTITIKKSSTIKTKLKENRKLKYNKYDLSEIGREKINKKIYKKFLQSKQSTLKPEDILGIINYMTKIISKCD